MKINNILRNLEYNDNKPAISILLETENSKEIRILLKEGQVMKEHQTPFPILVEVFEGEINFGVRGTIYNLVKGDLAALEGAVPHDLLAKKDSIIRLTLNKADKAERVKKVAEK